MADDFDWPTEPVSVALATVIAEPLPDVVYAVSVCPYDDAVHAGSAENADVKVTEQTPALMKVTDATF